MVSIRVDIKGYKQRLIIDIKRWYPGGCFIHSPAGKDVPKTPICCGRPNSHFQTTAIVSTNGCDRRGREGDVPEVLDGSTR